MTKNLSKMGKRNLIRSIFSKITNTKIPFY